MSEPFASAVLLTGIGVLLAAAVLVSRPVSRLGLPLGLIFLGVGMLAGEDGIGRIPFDDYALSYRLGTTALVFILFDGGLNTSLATVRAGLVPASVLATAGVAATAGAVAWVGHWVGLEWPQAGLLGAIVSSTDAAAVFAALRGSGLQLQRRVGVTLELESGLNDPMAVILTLALTDALLKNEAPSVGLLTEVVIEVGVGAAVGFLVGLGGREILRRVRLPAGGLYPVLTSGLALLAFGVPSLFHGSGFLAVYLAAVIMGDEAVRYKAGLHRVHDALAWLAQVGMFLMLGLLSTPHELVKMAVPGLTVGLALALIARPVIAVVLLTPFRFPLRESLYVGWVGLRGAVPIVLATIPVLAQAPGSKVLFDLVFFIVVVNAIVPGATVGWVTRKLKLMADAPPPPSAVLEITSTHALKGELVSYYVRPESAVAGATIAEVPLPEQAVITLIVRGTALVPPKGSTTLTPGDHVYMFCREDDLPLIDLLLGQREGH
ncbi:MAG: potassium/proton antiporter [Myxococcaceae bacterium]